MPICEVTSPTCYQWTEHRATGVGQLLVISDDGLDVVASLKCRLPDLFITGAAHNEAMRE